MVQTSNSGERGQNPDPCTQCRRTGCAPEDKKCLETIRLARLGTDNVIGTFQTQRQEAGYKLGKHFIACRYLNAFLNRWKLLFPELGVII